MTAPTQDQLDELKAVCKNQIGLIYFNEYGTPYRVSSNVLPVNDIERTVEELVARLNEMLKESK